MSGFFIRQYPTMFCKYLGTTVQILESMHKTVSFILISNYHSWTRRVSRRSLWAWLCYSRIKFRNADMAMKIIKRLVPFMTEVIEKFTYIWKKDYNLFWALWLSHKEATERSFPIQNWYLSSWNFYNQFEFECDQLFRE